MSLPTAVAPATSTAIRRSQSLQEIGPDRITESRMPRLSIKRWLCRLALASLAALGAAGAFAQTPLAGVRRLVDVIEVNDQEDEVDLTMVFNCSMRYVTSLPAREGKEVHIQHAPLAVCGGSPMSQIASETPPVSGGSSIVTAARVESMAPGQITLTLGFRKNRSEEHTSELQSRLHLVCRLLLEKKKKNKILTKDSTYKNKVVNEYFARQCV